MVHEQIRQAIQEFHSWPDVSFSFVEKVMKPFDNIYLPVHSFIAPEALQSAAGYLSVQVQANANPLPQMDSPSVI